MKKRLLSLLAFALGTAMGVQAQTTLIDYPTSKDGTAISGTTTEGVVKIHLNTDEVACYTLKNGYSTEGGMNGNHIKLTTEGGFKAGDVVTIAGAINNSDEAKRGTAVIFSADEEEKTPTVIHKFDDFINSRLVEDDPAEQSYTLEADYESLYLGRDGNTGTNLTLIKVVRPESGPTLTPAITFEGSAVERSIIVGLAAPGTAKVDWGDGVLVEGNTEAAYDLGWDENGITFTGTPSGTVKVYGEGIVAFDASGKFNEDKSDIPNALTAIDLTNAPDLVNLYLNVNKLNAIDVSKNTKLAKLNIANNAIAAISLTGLADLTNFTANDNQLEALDLATNTKLTAIVLSNNQIQTLDFSNNPLIKTFTCLNNQLTSVTIGANTAKNHTFQFGGNKLTSFNLMEATTVTGAYVYLRDNELTELLLPSNVTRIWVDGNAFTLPQLYELKGKQTRAFTYATTFTKDYAQTPWQITATDGVVDLSAQAKLGETATVFTWKTANGTTLVKGTDYTEADGVFTFLKDNVGIHCELTNAELPDFTAEKPYLTTTIDVKTATGIRDITVEAATIYYNLNGVRVTAPTKGIYVKNGRTVVIK